MDKKPTRIHHRALAAAGALATATLVVSGRGIDADFVPPAVPFEAAAQLTADPAEWRTVPAEAALVFSANPPGRPLAEPTAVVRQQEAFRNLSVALGSNAAEGADTKFRDAFARFEPTLRGNFQQVPDRDAVEMLLLGKTDLALIGGRLSEREFAAGLREHTLGVELFALVVPPESPVRSLTSAQVRQIFTGAVTDWQQLGYAAGPIVPVVPSHQGLCNRAQRALIAGDAFASACVRVASERHVVDQLLRNKGGIGVVRLTDGTREPGQQLVQIDWVEPSATNFAAGTYPHGTPVQLISAHAGFDPAVEALLEFAKRGEGRQLLGRTFLTLP